MWSSWVSLRFDVERTVVSWCGTQSPTHSRQKGLTNWPMWACKSSRASSHAYTACQIKVRSTNVGSGTFSKIFCQYTLCPGPTQETHTKWIVDYPPANRIRWCRYSADVVLSSICGWKEIIVLPSTWRMRWTESRLSTSWRWPSNWLT